MQKAQYVGNAFDPGFITHTAALMILLTFPGDFKDLNGANQISVLSLCSRLGSINAVGLLGFCFLWFRDEETWRLSIFLNEC